MIQFTGELGLDPRTEYEDKMKIIEKDYEERKITEKEYIQLKDLADQQGTAEQEGGFNEPWPN